MTVDETREMYCPLCGEEFTISFSGSDADETCEEFRDCSSCGVSLNFVQTDWSDTPEGEIGYTVYA